MKTYKLILFTLVFGLFYGNAQQGEVFISLKRFKQKYKRALTKKDSLNFRFHKNDTLVLDEFYVAPTGTKVPYDYKDDNFLEIYKSVAFNNVTDSTKQKSFMHYWKDDIKMYISKSFDKKTRKAFFDFTNKVSKKIDSLNIYQVKDPKDSNYIIYTDSDFQYEPRMSKYKSTDYYVYWNNKNQIYRMSMRLKNDIEFNSNLKLNKLKNQFIISLGQFNYTNNNLDCKNFFSGCSKPNFELTELDYELIKYHYSYGICKGTDLKTFEDNHKHTKENINKNKVLTNLIHN